MKNTNHNHSRVNFCLCNATLLCRCSLQTLSAQNVKDRQQLNQVDGFYNAVNTHLAIRCVFTLFVWWVSGIVCLFAALFPPAFLHCCCLKLPSLHLSPILHPCQWAHLSSWGVHIKHRDWWSNQRGTGTSKTFIWCRNAENVETIGEWELGAFKASRWQRLFTQGV